jgi:hypothetical protein
MTTSVATGNLDLPRIERLAWIVGLCGLAACALGASLNLDQFFRSYLVAFCFCLGIALGSLAILLLQYLTGGGWGLVLRRPLEAGTRTLPLLALLFVPVLMGMGSLYVWAHPSQVDGAPALEWKRPYLNVTFFAVRAVFYFAAWLAFAYLLNRRSRNEDRAQPLGSEHAFRNLCGVGLGIYGLTMTFAAIDWGMSLEPHWYSSMYGALFAFSQVLSAFSCMTAAVILLSAGTGLNGHLHPQRLRDLGNLLMAFVMMWAYLSFSQFLLIWSGNLREEIPWYLHRMEGGWQYVALFLLLFSFVVPFLMLLNGDLKTNPRLLVWVALLVLAMRFVELIYLVKPAFSPAHFQLHWLDLATLVGVGGIWLAFFTRQVRSMPVLPLHDPRLLEASNHHA